MGKKLLGIVIVCSVLFAILGPVFNAKNNKKNVDREVASQTEAKAIENSTAPKVNSGIRVVSAQKYIGYIISVNKTELPAELEGFTKLAISIGAYPFDVENNGISKYILENAFVCSNNTYESIAEAGTWYVLVVLCNDSNEAMGYYETTVEIIAPDPIRVPEASNGVEVKHDEEIHGIKIAVNVNNLPAGMEEFQKMAVAISTKPYDVEKMGLPYDSTVSAKAYPNHELLTAVQKAGTWYVLIVLCDRNRQALGYYETSIEIPYVPEIEVPAITSGITVENALTYTGYELIVVRSGLPEWAQGYSKIGVAVSAIRPFNTSEEGLPFNLNSILTYDESPEGVTVIGSYSEAMAYYVLIALYDDYCNPIGYLDTSIAVKKRIEN
jgi:hypothetical protein